MWCDTVRMHKARAMPVLTRLDTVHAQNLSKMTAHLEFRAVGLRHFLHGARQSFRVTWNPTRLA